MHQHAHIRKQENVGAHVHARMLARTANLASYLVHVTTRRELQDMIAAIPTAISPSQPQRAIHWIGMKNNDVFPCGRPNARR